MRRNGPALRGYDGQRVLAVAASRHRQELSVRAEINPFVIELGRLDVAEQVEIENKTRKRFDTL
jgi:hypothetical protein